MKLLGPASVRLRGRASSPLLLFSSLLAVGCVGLTKPQKVRDCEQASLGCVNGAPPANRDAANDPTQPGPDLAASDKPTTVSPDAAPDNAPLPPDSPLDTADTATGKDDVPADTRSPSDPVADGQTSQNPDGVRNDLPVEKAPGAESGTEPSGGAEPGPEKGPEPGKEPGPEPGLEPGPEPGPEPGREPGPEPAPEPPRDAGSTAACANATPIGDANGTGNAIFQTTGAFCFVTCDGMENWGCASFDQTIRAVKVNGTAVDCGAALPAKKSGYRYFEIAANATAGHTWDAIWWSGTPAATTCTPPAGGFSP